MFFEVINFAGFTVMSTYQRSCVYDKATLSSMLSAGYRFRLDGKLIPKHADVLSMIKDSEINIPKVEPIKNNTAPSIIIANEKDKVTVTRTEDEENMIIKALGF